jgi:uncharacterized integral membrane protein (TIGR00698 family)
LNNYYGILLSAILAAGAFSLAHLAPLQELNISPLIIAILIGMIIGNTVYAYIPVIWTVGIRWVQQKVLRLGIILYGLQITFQDIYAVGLQGLLIDIFIVASVFLLGTWCGMRWLKLDRDTAMLTSIGSAICGAAAVIATEPVLRAENHKTALAVATVVLFGTIAMVIYPILFYYLNLSPDVFGIYIGATVHEVAQVVAAGEAIGFETATTAVIVKLTRVILLAPFLILLSLYVSRQNISHQANSTYRSRVIIPWFAFGFIAVSAINSLQIIPENITPVLIKFDIFLLTMAMMALGMETNFQKFKTVGWKPVLLAGGLFIYLLVVGYALVALI